MKNYHFFINSAVKNSHDTGRPKNGMFVAVPTELKDVTKDVSPGHWRVQAVIATMPNKRILIINSYFPVDQRTMNVNDNDLFETLEAIDKVINDNDFETLIVTGDLNADFVRNSGHVRTVMNFLAERNLMKTWDNFEIEFTCMHEANNVTSTSTIDHFFYNEAAADSIVDAGVLSIPENSSDHCPIYCVIDAAEVPTKHTKTIDSKPRPSWKKAEQEEKENYHNLLKVKLENLEIPQCVEMCSDVHCSDDNHQTAIDDYAASIFEALDS